MRFRNFDPLVRGPGAKALAERTEDGKVVAGRMIGGLLVHARVRGVSLGFSGPSSRAIVGVERAIGVIGGVRAVIAPIIVRVIEKIIGGERGIEVLKVVVIVIGVGVGGRRGGHIERNKRGPLERRRGGRDRRCSHGDGSERE
jgi:hypothetical protein